MTIGVATNIRALRGKFFYETLGMNFGPNLMICYFVHRIMFDQIKTKMFVRRTVKKNKNSPKLITTKKWKTCKRNVTVGKFTIKTWMELSSKKDQHQKMQKRKTPTHSH